MKKLKMKSNESHTYKIINISRWATWIVFVIELNLWLPCFGLSALYLPTPDPTLPAGPPSLKIQRIVSRVISRKINYLWDSVCCRVSPTRWEQRQLCCRLPFSGFPFPKQIFFMLQHDCWFQSQIRLKDILGEDLGKRKTPHNPFSGFNTRKSKGV